MKKTKNNKKQTNKKQKTQQKKPNKQTKKTPYIFNLSGHTLVPHKSMLFTF